MPDNAGPFDGPTFGQAPYYRDRGYLEPSGVQGTPQATAAGGDLGLTAAGFALTLGLGRAHVRGAAYERTGTAWTYTVPANTATAGPRNDLLVLRRDLVAKTVVPTYLQGTAAATPTDPAVTQTEDGTWDVPLFRVQAPASSGTPSVVTEPRKWIGAGDSTQGTDTGWQTLALSTAAALTNGTTGNAYRIRDRIVQLVIDIAYGSTWANGFTLFAAALPAEARPTRTHFQVINWYGGTQIAPIQIGTDGLIRLSAASPGSPGGLTGTLMWIAG